MQYKAQSTKPEYRDSIVGDEKALKLTFIDSPAFAAAWHLHPHYELTYIHSSSGLRYVGDTIENFEAGDFVLLAPNVAHSWKTVGTQTARVNASVVHWDTDILGKDWLLKPEFQSIRGMFASATRGLKFNPAGRDSYASDLLAMHHLSDFTKLMQFLGLLERLSHEPFVPLCAVDFQNQLDNNDGWRMDKIFSFVRNHYQQEVTLSDVAELTAMNREAFCRYFKRATSKSFFTFLNEYRVNLACKELMETDLSVGEIAFRCGFNSPGFFHKQFIKFKGMPPLSYRRTHRTIPVKG